MALSTGNMVTHGSSVCLAPSPNPPEMAQRWVQGGCSWQLVTVQTWANHKRPHRHRGESDCSLWRSQPLAGVEMASKVGVSVLQQWEARGRWWLRLEKSGGTRLKEAYLSHWYQQSKPGSSWSQPGPHQDVIVEVSMWEPVICSIPSWSQEASQEENQLFHP